MSSNRPARLLAVRVLGIAGIAALAAACASSPTKPTAAQAARLPTEQYAATVTSQPDQILLAPHADGLSSAQAVALSQLVQRWRDAGGGPIIVQAPNHGGGEAYRAATNVQSELTGLGVSEDQIRLVGYAGDDRPGAPIVVSFDRYEARVPDCGRKWDNFTSTATNKPDGNFGCAVTANIAAMVANPADLVHAQPMDPADSGRREFVLGKYREGQATSTAKDDQASGAISSVVH